MRLWEDLTAGAARGQGSLKCWTGSEYSSASWADVVRDAERMTAGLRSAGVAPGARVATILTNAPATVRGILATWLAGGTIASLPVPSRGMEPQEYSEQLRRLCDQLDPAALVVEAGLRPALPDELGSRVAVHDWESMEGSGRVEASPPEGDDVAFIQFSSGSTRMPKGCMLTTRAIEAQLWLIVEMLQARRGGETVVSWLPLSHDMGIFGALLAPWLADEDLLLSSPQRFMLSPRSWFADVADSGATITVGTNTALALAARVQGSSKLSGPLRLHTVILGAERNEWETLERALETFGPWGLRPEALMPAYGLAEATLAVTRTPREEAPRRLTVDGLALAEGAVNEVAADDPSATHLVSAGTPCPGVELYGLEPGRSAQLRLRSPSLAVGYFGEDARQRETFVDDGLVTGDIAFAHEGHLYPVGRTDDVISVAGRKVYACELEAAIDDLEGVRRGCTTMVDTSAGGTQSLTLLMELRDDAKDVPTLARDAAGLAMSKAAVALDRCVFLPKGALPKTPTGKVQRYRCREMLSRERFEPLEVVELA